MFQASTFLRAAAAAFALSLAACSTTVFPADAQTRPATTHAEITGPHDFIDPDETVLLLIDHQVGLTQLVRDISPEQYKDAVLGLAKGAKAMNIPVILTTSRDWGPNGQIMPELTQLFPEVEVIRRPGVINAYRWPDFRKAVEATGRKKVIIAAITGSTCLLFPALDMEEDGYEVFAVIDASGHMTEIEREVTIASLVQSGAEVRNWWSLIAELRADWRRDEAEGWPVAQVYGEHFPTYGYLMSTSMDYATGKMTPPAE